MIVRGGSVVDVSKEIAWKDDVVECLATFATQTHPTGDRALLDGAKRVLIDTVAVGLGASAHPAAQCARRYLEFFPADPNGAAIWGSSLRAAPDKATLLNGVLLRCYDYNDVMVARRGAGHPSDMIAALMALCDWRDLSGHEMLQAIVLGYEVAEAMHDVVAAEEAGWDHANISAIGATCALGRLIGLDADQMGEAIGIAAIQHIASNEIESSATNRRGDLTMWKRFHGADAMRHALDACLLAAAGAEAPVRPFRGRLGFLSIFRVDEDPAPYLADRLRPGNLTGAVNRTNFKRWPVGSRGQSAVAAALDARSKLPGDAQIESVLVRTEPGVYNHLVGIRADPWRPQSRETADHSLPYIVGAAVLDGQIDVGSFDLAKVLNPERARFIAERVKVEVSEELTCGAQGIAHHISHVEIRTKDGSCFEGAARPGPGHCDNPFGAQDLLMKLHESGDTLLGAERVELLFGMMNSMEEISVREFAGRLMTT